MAKAAHLPVSLPVILLVLLVAHKAASVSYVSCPDTSCYDKTLTCRDDTCVYTCDGFAGCDHTIFEAINANITVRCNSAVGCPSAMVNASGASEAHISCEGVGSCSRFRVKATPEVKVVNMTLLNLATARRAEWHECFAQSGCGIETCVLGEDSCQPPRGEGFGAEGGKLNIADMIGDFRYSRVRADNIVLIPGGAFRILVLRENLTLTSELVENSLAGLSLAFGHTPALPPPVRLYNEHIIEIETDHSWWNNTFKGNFGARLNERVEKRGLVIRDYVDMHPEGLTMYIDFETEEAKQWLNSTEWLIFQPFIQTEFRKYFMSVLNLPSICVEGNFGFSDTYTYLASIILLNTRDCNPPAPFFGACCINGTWRSTLDSSVDFPELLLSSSPIAVAGSSSVRNVDFVLSGTAFTVQQSSSYSDSNLRIMDSSYSTSDLNLANSAILGSNFSLSVSSNLSFSGHTTLSPSDSNKITVVGCAELSGTLVVKTPMAKTDTKTLLDTNCVSGGFSEVLVEGHAPGEFCVQQRKVPTSQLMQLLLVSCELTGSGSSTLSHFAPILLSLPLLSFLFRVL